MSRLKVADIIGIYEVARNNKTEGQRFPDVWREVKKTFLELAQKENVSDPGQCWKTTSGKAFEKITVEFILEIVTRKEFRDQHISASSYYDLDSKEKKRLSYELVRKCTDDRIEISNEPDIVIFKNDRPRVLVSCKSSLRDRVSMDLFWALEYSRRNYKYTLVCAETSQAIGSCKKPKKPRKLAEAIYDRLYIVNGDMEYCDIVRPFHDIEKDLKHWLFE